MLRRLVALLAAVSSSATFAEDWSGPYIGGAISYGGGPAYLNQWTIPSLYFNGFSGDLRAGYLIDAGAFSVGIEALYSPFPIVAHIQYAAVRPWRELSVSNTFTVRGRIGLPVGRFQPYVAAGISRADFSHTYSEDLPYVATAPVLGPHIAAGIDWLATSDFSVGAEVSNDFYPQSAMDNGGWVTRWTPNPMRLSIVARYRF